MQIHIYHPQDTVKKTIQLMKDLCPLDFTICQTRTTDTRSCNVTGKEVRSYGGPIIFSSVVPSRTNVTRNSGLVGPTFRVL